MLTKKTDRDRLWALAGKLKQKNTQADREDRNRWRNFNLAKGRELVGRYIYWADD